MNPNESKHVESALNMDEKELLAWKLWDAIQKRDLKELTDLIKKADELRDISK